MYRLRLFRGLKAKVARDKAIVKDIVKANDGLTLGAGVGAIYDSKKFDRPYLRDFLLNYQVFGDVSETGVTWADLKDLHASVYDAFDAQRKAVGKPGFLFCPMSHSYHGGVCLYFTFAISYDAEETALDDYYAPKNAVQDAFGRHHRGNSRHPELASNRGVPAQNLDCAFGDLLCAGVFLLGADDRRGHASGGGLWPLGGVWGRADRSVGTRYLEGTPHPAHDPRTGVDHARGVAG